MKRIWSGQPLAADIGPIGPSPVQQGGPELLIGGYTPHAIQRVGRWGDGFIVGGAGPDMARQAFALAEQAWKAAGRAGKPRFVACMYWGLGLHLGKALPQNGGKGHLLGHIVDYGQRLMNPDQRGSASLVHATDLPSPMRHEARSGSPLWVSIHIVA